MSSSRHGAEQGTSLEGRAGPTDNPPFSLSEVADYPARLEVDYPEQLSRGLVLVKWWLLAIPHYLVVGVFLGGSAYVVKENGDVVSSGTGLVYLLVLFAGVSLLFTARYPLRIFDLVLGLDRWVLQVTAYVALMTDQYPPFAQDQGGHEDSAGSTSAVIEPSDPSTTPS